jgi:hypothetical protein
VPIVEVIDTDEHRISSYSQTELNPAGCTAAANLVLPNKLSRIRIRGKYET